MLAKTAKNSIWELTSSVILNKLGNSLEKILHVISAHLRSCFTLHCLFKDVIIANSLGKYKDCFPLMWKSDFIYQLTKIIKIMSPSGAMLDRFASNLL